MIPDIDASSSSTSLILLNARITFMGCITIALGVEESQERPDGTTTIVALLLPCLCFLSFNFIESLINGQLLV
uniref:Uncharacterized protein n=1 Tax=Glossina brevipalpis TaxID=37001 RepID=A0A1A9X410_9MUSC